MKFYRRARVINNTRLFLAAPENNSFILRSRPYCTVQRGYCSEKSVEYNILRFSIRTVGGGVWKNIRSIQCQ